MPKSYWLVKSEPTTYSWQDLLRDKHARWDGVRNFEARNNLRSMKRDDLVLCYHSGKGREIVGIAKVVKAAYPDPTATEGEWYAVDLARVKALTRPVALAALKAEQSLANLEIIRKSRISVTKVLPAEFARILQMADTRV